jgi:exopolyphosphatase/guanosine-5'-triphosphate,3'-diphosphate pyrophosphatase
MLSIEKYAAIDIGSNAIRLLIANVIEQKEGPTLFRKNALVRVPIRLGEDVFTAGKISPNNQERMTEALRAFRLLMNIHNVKHYRACATSAMREASNGYAFAKAIKEKTSINIEIINGEEEAAIIAATDLHHFIKKDKTYLYVDVGGGSTEFTVYDKGEAVRSKSFKIGTVRILKGVIDKSLWNDIIEWISKNTSQYRNIQVLGTGGNINKIFKLSGLKVGKPLTYLYLVENHKKLSKLSYSERITKLSLNPDRADVIIPALEIYLKAMKWSKAEHLLVPKVGLSDGIIKLLYQENMG